MLGMLNAAPSQSEGTSGCEVTLVWQQNWGWGVSVTSLLGCREPDPVDHREREGTTQRTAVLQHYISCIAS